MKKEATLNTINNKSLLKTMAAVALPIALQSLIGSSLNLVDNLMVGSLGEAELNAVGVSVQFYFVHWMLLYGFTSGTATFMAQYFGVKDFHNIRKTVGFALTVTVSVSMLFFLTALIFPHYVLRIFTRFPEIIELGSGYVRACAPAFLFTAVTVPFTSALRATQQTRLPLYISGAAFLTNTFLNYLLIFGSWGAPKLGVAGAALATMIARGLEMSLILYMVFGRKNKLCGPIREFFSYTKSSAVKIVKNAVPTTINETMWGLGTSLYVAAFARIGVTEGAAVQACSTINNLFIMAAFSIGDATLILVGQKLGEGKLDYAYQLAKKMVKIGLVIGLAAGGLLIVFGKPLLSLFEFTDRGAHFALLILIVYGCTMWLTVYNAVNVTGVLRCGGDTRFAMLAEVLAVWCVGVPVAFLTALVLQWPIYFAVLAVKLEDVVKGIAVTKRFFSKKWVKNVISE
ncbi:MATE family efflux transporter [Zhenpiania hominis]|uniref:Probable multidrug resistance protein NorM n=4 Tax=Zhenpiania hominis TaxID=2763644 RepID=A0A923NNI2_9FIRM|nr:MATE family efflux transporter [Zhenpiania hominis]MBC6680387.1 MATE family efflux transporter [Zhenpiania hominis]